MIRLAVDTNILFSFFWKKSFSRQVLLKAGLELFSPEFALEGINRHMAEILKRTGINSAEFNVLREEMAIAVNFVSLENYRGFLKRALEMCPDSKDIDFFALALKLKVPLWSNDSMLKRQNKVIVLSTKDLLEKPEFAEVLFPD